MKISLLFYSLFGNDLYNHLCGVFEQVSSLVKKSIYRISFFLLFFLLTGTFQQAFADGSKDLYPAGASGNRASLYSTNNSAVNAGSFPFKTRGTQYVYVKAGEYITAGSSAIGIRSANNVPLPAIILTSPNGTVVNTTTTEGLIANRTQELGGPMSPLASGTDATKFKPYSYLVKPGEEGIWRVDMDSPASSVNDGGPQAGTFAAVANWTQANDRAFIAAWDVSVWSSVAPGDGFIHGRVYANILNLGLNGGFGKDQSYFGVTYVLTKDGRAYRVDNNGNNGFGFAFFANNKGFIDAAGNSTFKSLDVPSPGSAVQDPRIQDDAARNLITHKLFYTKPAPDLPLSDQNVVLSNGITGSTGVKTTTWLKKDAVVPTVTNVSFVGSEGTAGQASQKGGYVSFSANVAGSYRVTIPIAGGTDRVLTGTANAGVNQVKWDGKDGSGQLLPGGVLNPIVKVRLTSAEVHFPFIDMEINPQGFIIELTENKPDNSYTIDNTSSDESVYSDRVYWDDSAINPLNSTSGGPAPNPIVNTVNGISSRQNGHKWGTYGNGAGFGDAKSLDTYAYILSNEAAVPLNVTIKVADLQIESIASNIQTVSVGGDVTFTVKVKNSAGSSDIAGSKFNFDVPAGFVIKTVTGSSSCATESGANNSGARYQSTLDLPGGCEIVYTITGTVDATLKGQPIPVTASILRPNDVTDPDATNTVFDQRPASAQVECDAAKVVTGTNCNNILTNSQANVANPLGTVTGGQVVCEGTAPVVITFTGSNSSPAYTFYYNINGVAQTPQVSGPDGTAVVNQPTVPGTYIYDLIAVSDGNSSYQNPQSGTTATTTVVVNPLSTASISGSTAVCQNSTAVSVTFTGTGGTAPYIFTYTLNGGAAQQVTSDASGQYVLSQATNVPGDFQYVITSISGQNGCSHVQSVSSTVKVNPLLTASLTGSTPVCQNGAAVPVTLKGTGGTAPYTFTYTVNGGAPQDAVSDELGEFLLFQDTGVPGDFTYVITSISDQNNCPNVQPVSTTVTVRPLSIASMSASTSVCQNTTAVPVTFTGTGGVAPYRFTYAVNGGTAQQVVSNASGQFVLSQATNVPGIYKYVITAISDRNGCPHMQSVSTTVTVNPFPTAGISGTATVCANGTPAVITFTGTGGTAPYTFTYTVNGGTAQVISTTGTSDHIDLSQATNIPGDYKYVITSISDINGCPNAQSASSTIRVNPLSTASISANTAVCQNSAAVPVTFTGMGGTAPYTFTYTINDGVPQQAISNASGQYILSQVTSVQGDFTYVITSISDQNGCANAQSVSSTVTVHPLSTASISASTSVCQNSTTVPVTFTGTGGTAPYTFTYTLNGGAAQVISTTGVSDHVDLPQATNVQGNFTYVITSISDQNNCANAQSVTNTVTVGPMPTAGISGMATVCASGTPSVITFTGTGGTAPYTFTYTMNGGAAQVISTTGTSDHIDLSQATDVPGNYTYVITNISDRNGCPNAQSVSSTLTVNPLSIASIPASTAVCQNSPAVPVTFTGTGGTAPYTFTYTVNGGAAQMISTIGTSDHIDVFQGTGIPGDFQYVITNISGSNGCANLQSASSTVTVYPTPTVSPVTDITLCNNTSQGIITFSGPVAGTTYSWSKDGTDIGLPVSSGTSNLPAFTAVNNTTAPISSVITVVPTANGCEGTPLTFKITVNPTATVSPVTDITLCNNTAQGIITFSSPVAGTTYSWSKDGTDIGLPVSSGTSNLPAFTAVNNTTALISSVITVVPTANGCEGTPLTFKITVNPTATVSPVTDITLCNNTAQGIITFSSPVAGTTYSWSKDGTDIGLPVSSGTSNLPAFTAVNNTTAPISSVITVVPTANGCEGTPLTFKITVNPTATVSPITDITLCNNAPQGIITFSSPVAGTTYSWSKDGTDIGLAVSSGTSNLPAFTAVNNTTAPISSVITVVPTANGCEGTPLTFRITVNPTATVSPVTDITLCNNTAQGIITFSSPVAGTTYSWSKDGTDIGLPVSSGTSNLPAFTAVNNTTAPISSVITVVPTANGCEGTPLTFKITVNPTATVSPVTDITLCNNTAQGIITFSSPVAGTTYSWSKDGTDIGLPVSSGTSNLPAFTAVNNTTAPISSVITVVPTANGCEGTPLTFRITVNPTATVEPVSVPALCNGATQNSVVFSGTIAGTTYHWSKDGTDIGLPVSSGTSNLPAFTAVNNTTAPISSVITVVPTANGCEGTPLTFRITVNPTATVSPVTDITLCNNTAQGIITFSNPVAGTTYSWSKDGTDIGLPVSSGTSNLPAFIAVNNTTAPVSSVITVVPTSNGCEGTPLTFKITVNPTATISPIADITLCNNTSQGIITFSSPVAGTTYSWSKDGTDIGLPVSSGTSNLPAFTAVNNTTAPISSVITVVPTANGCEGTPLTFRITVNPTATVEPVSVPALCNGATQNSVVFSGTIAGTTYHWSKDGTDIGLPVSSGTSNLPAFTAVNNTTAPISSVITVVPTANGCEGTPLTFRITVNPTATVSPVTDITLCNNTAQGIITFSNPVAGTTYSWSKDGTDIGLPVSSGTSNLPAFIAVNNTTAPVSSVITVVPTSNGCEGTPLTFKITVNPTATISPIADITLCNNTSQGIITFSSPVAGTTYSWSKDGTDIGLPVSSGTSSNLPAFTAVNNTTAPVSSVITVVPTANGCEGTPLTFKITVNPTATVSQVADITLCNNASQNTVVFSSPVAGTTYSWSKDGTDIGLPVTSGTSNLPAFTAVNNTTAPISSVITVVPTANGCEGTPLTFKITVNPTATVSPVTDITLCNNTAQGIITFSSPVAGTTYSWSKDGTDIGLPVSSGTSNLPAFTAVNNTTAPISSVITVVPTANGCEGTPLTFRITVNPTATVEPVSVPALCNGATQNSVVFSGTIAGTTYHWSKDGTDIGLPVTSGTSNLPAFTAVNNTTAAISSVITVVPTANGCEGTPLTFKITVNPTATVSPIADITLCNNAPQGIITFSSPVAGTTYSWSKDGTDIGLPVSSGTSNLPAFTAVNNTTAPISSVITVVPTANGCEGTPLTFRITVNPTATVSPVTDITLCNNTAQGIITFSSPVAGTTYSWSKDGTDIGLPVFSGTSNLPAFTAVNNTTAPVSSVITVVPTANGCEGTPLTFKITVNPTATVSPVTDITLCNNTAQGIITFSSPVAGTTYSWSKDGTDIGLPVSSGTSNLPAFTAVNNTTAPISSVITVVPTANGCEGTPLTFRITVNPTATVSPVTDITLCNNTAQGIITFSSPVAGTTYSWSKDGTDIGLPVSSGTSNLPAFTAVNNTTAPISSVITVVPTANGCEGTPLTFKITVNPTATVSPVTDITLCNNTAQGIITFSSPVAGTTYSWSKDGTDIGLPVSSGTSNLPAFTAVNNTTAPISSVITVVPTANGCEGTPLTFKITVNPTATVSPVADITLCNNTAQGIITFSSPVAGTTYSWSKDGTDIGLPVSSGTSNLPAFTAVNNTTAPISSVITVVPTANGCEGTPLTFKITVNPTATVSPVTDITLCNNAPQGIITFSSPVAGTTYSWSKDGTDIGLPVTSGTSNLPAFTAVNNTTAPISSVITVVPTANGCEGTPLTFKITVNPTATVSPITDITLCNNTAQGIIIFSSPVAGTTYSWSKDGTDIGLPVSSGTSNLPAFTAVNNTTAPISSVITVVPTANGCEGTPLTFKITVNPTATVSPVADITLCNNTAQGIITFSSPVAGTTYSWSKDGTDIGLPVTSGTSNLPAFTAVNTTNAPISSIFTVTPTANGCEGTPLTFKITVNPTATVSPVTDITLCNNAPQGIIIFSSPVAGTTYSWSKDGTDIGLPVSSGTSNLPAFTAVNNTTAPISSVITVVPTANGCEGTPLTFKITVNPTATVSPVTDITLCNNAPQGIITFSSPVAGTTYSWSKDGTDIGLPVSSGTSSNLPAFTVVNNTAAPVSSVITVVPTANGCEGTPLTFKITVNPTATVSPITDITLCNNASQNTVVFSSPVAGTTYSWSKDGTDIGLPVSSGDGNLPAFTAVNTTIAPISSTFTVTPKANGCEGTPMHFTITVNPTPTVLPVSVPALCNGANQASVVFSGPVAGTTYHWTKDGTDIGLPVSSGDGNLPSFTAVNETNAPVSSVITVTPKANGCEGTPIRFTITVNPDATITLTSATRTTVQSVCINNDITEITYQTKNADRVEVTGLPAGVRGTSANGMFTIHGTPSEPGIFHYTVTATGICRTAQLSGTITVNPRPAGYNDIISNLSCGNTAISYNLQDNINNTANGGNSVPSAFTWTVAPNHNVTGITNGSGNVISTTLHNLSHSVQQVIYTVIPASTLGGCPGQSFTVTVNVPVCSEIILTKTADVSVVSQAGDLIRYTITVKNLATANHTGVKVTDPFLGGILAGPSSGDNGNGILEANESWVYTGTYRVTQSDIDNNGKPNAGSGKIINTATVNTIEQPAPLSASSSVDIVTTGNITLVKAGRISTDFSTITYTFTVTNTGRVRLHNLNLTDPKMGGRINLNPDVLDAGASVVTTVIYTVTDAEKRDGQVINTATVTGVTPAGDMVTDISGTQDNNNDPTLNIIDDSPQAINDNASTMINQPVTFSLTDNDLPSFNGLDKGSIVIVNFPKNGIVQVNPDGTVTYTPNRTYSGPDSFTYTITDLKGRISNKALVSIQVIPIDLFIPNTFTPNGDGKNDTFRIIGRESFDSIDLLIFNRWGNEVYRRNNYLDDWDGSGLNEGTYYYLITLKKGGNEIVKKGWILLKR